VRLHRSRRGNRTRRGEFAADLADSLVGKVVPDGVDRVDGTPYSEERHALDLLGRLTLDLSGEDSAAIWESTLGAGEPELNGVVGRFGEVKRRTIERQTGFGSQTDTDFHREALEPLGSQWC
jgi:hypothetical protein